MDSLAGQHRRCLGRDGQSDRVHLQGRVERLFEIVELRHPMNGVEQGLAFLLRLLGPQDGRRRHLQDRSKFFELCGIDGLNEG